MQYRAWVLMAPLALGCTGEIASVPTGVREGSAAGGEARSGGAGGTSPNGPGGMTPAACGAGISAPIADARVWRLSPRQYANTVKQVFGVDVDVSAFPLDGVSDDELTKFDTNADANLVTTQFADALQTQARSIGDAYVATLVAAHACVVDASPAAACAAGFWKDLAGKAYRRPLAPAEIERLVTLWEAARMAYDAKTATRMTVEAIAQAPSFVYRSELGAGTGAKVPLTQHELASELSYVLADGPPDDALRAAADAGELTSPASLRPHAERLLKLPGARAKLQSFFATYLNVRALVEGKKKDPAKFPVFTAAFGSSLVDDALAQVGRIAFDGAGTLDALWSTKIDLGAGLTTVYGAGASRTGLLTHPAVIAALSNESATSPVHRGLFFYRTMLCGAVPPPPANASSQVAKLTDPDNPDGTQREQWTYFQQNAPGCAACHRTFQPLGLSLESYDAIGRYRADERGKPIDPRVEVTGLDEQIDGAHADGVALASKIAASDRGRACFALQLTTFALGRAVDWDDPNESCRLQGLARSFAGKPLDLRALLRAMTEDDAFFFRRRD